MAVVHVDFRPLRRDDLPLLGQWLGAPHVEPWWRELARAVRDVWRRYPDVVAVVIPVQKDNRRSWRALEKVGFRRAWSGLVDSGDLSDHGPSHVYVLDRPA